MVDLPMSEGNFCWKIKADNMSAGGYFRIGVAEKNIDLDITIKDGSFWGY